MFSFAGYMIGPAESSVLTEMDAMGSIVRSACNACGTSQLVSRMLSPPDFPHQLPTHVPSSWLDQGYKSDQASGGL